MEEAEIELAMNKSQNTWIVDFQYYSYDADHIYPKEISVINCFTADMDAHFLQNHPTLTKNHFNADDTFQYQFKLHKTPWTYGDVAGLGI